MGECTMRPSEYSQLLNIPYDMLRQINLTISTISRTKRPIAESSSQIFSAEAQPEKRCPIIASVQEDSVTDAEW